MKQGGVNFAVTPSLTATNSGQYLTDVSLAESLAADQEGGLFNVNERALTWPVDQTVTIINDLNNGSYINWINDLGKDDKGVLLFEGAKMNYGGSPDDVRAPLVFEIVEKASGIPALSISLNISLDSIERMYRQLNLIADEGGPASGVWPSGTEYGGVSSMVWKGSENNRGPLNYPDSETSDTQYFVYLHGYNVNGQQARAEQSGMFKRLYWSGSKARFWGITWYGFETQGFRPGRGGFSPNFHKNVVHAIHTSTYITQKLAQYIPPDAQITLAAHSLGNAVLSSFIQDHYAAGGWKSKATIKNVFLLNAAIALATLDGSIADIEGGGGSNSITSNSYMYHDDWWDYSTNTAIYDKKLWAANYYNLYSEDPSDERGNLTWRDRFGDLTKLCQGDVFEKPEINCFNYYSTGETALAPLTSDVRILESVLDITYLQGLGGNYAFALEERLKGRVEIPWPWPGIYGDSYHYVGAALPAGSSYGGWDFNSLIKPDPAEANGKPRNELKINPIFDHDALFPENKFGDLFNPDSSGSEYAKNHRDRLLAEAIPVLSLPVGGPGGVMMEDEDVFDDANVHDMQTRFKNGWPKSRDNVRWKHSDVHEIGYTYIYNLWDNMVIMGGLK